MVNKHEQMIESLKVKTVSLESGAGKPGRPRKRGCEKSKKLSITMCLSVCLFHSLI
jgi:hypothetical protein